MATIVIAGCAIIEHGALLLLYKRRHQHYEFPGGWIEAGESPAEAAVREVKEEIGCQVQNVKPFHAVEFDVKDEHILGHVFLAELTPGQTPKILEPELFDHLCWIPLADARSFPVAPNVHLFCLAYQDYLNNGSPAREERW